MRALAISSLFVVACGSAVTATPRTNVASEPSDPLPAVAPSDGGADASLVPDAAASGDGGTTCPNDDCSIAPRLHAAPVAVGTEYMCAIASDASVYCWGSNDRGQLGIASTESLVRAPTRVAIDDAVGLTASSHTCAWTKSGELFCWGLNEVFELGIGRKTEAGERAPVRVEGMSHVTKAVAGWRHSCAITRDGAAYCWGLGVYGAIGNGSQETAKTPQKVALADVVDIAAGTDFSCALTRDGAVHCWGSAGYGTLGTGDLVSSALPRRVASPPLNDGDAFTSLSAGNHHVCAGTKLGGLLCWGDNMWGQLGTGQREINGIEPAPVVGRPQGLAQVASGGSHTCVRSGSGGVSCFGRGLEGQIGNGGAGVVPVPFAIPDLQASFVAAANDTTCALSAAGGALFCWGEGVGESPTRMPAPF